MRPPNVDESWGCVIGRFQPFHLDHLSLATEVITSGRRVIVAITNVELAWRVPVDEAPHRHTDAANPFSYAQRVQMVRAALLPLVSPDDFRVTPFPIHDPNAWFSHLPPGTQCWVRDRGPWESRKIRELAAQYPVESRPGLSVERSGTEIRRRIRAGDASWADDVAPPVAALIEDWLSDGRLRLREDGSHGVAADGHDC
jgi:cytidyltransferase-like protein